MEPVTRSRPRLSIARAMRLIVYLAVALGVVQGHPSLLLYTMAFVCWMLIAYELAHILFPDVFSTVPLRSALGDLNRPMVLPNAVTPWMSLGELSRGERELADAGLSFEAAMFILSTLKIITVGPTPKGEEHRASKILADRHHVTAAELCAAVQRQATFLAGDEAGASALLHSLGLRTGEDVGHVVMKLVEMGWMQRLESETFEDFCGLTIDVRPG